MMSSTAAGAHSVEVGAKALREHVMKKWRFLRPLPWDRLPEIVRDNWRKQARIVLRAALANGGAA